MTDDMRQLADDMEAFLPRLRERLAGASHAALYHRPGPAEWSSVEVVGHLEDVDALFMGRLHAILTEDRPAFTVYLAEPPVEQRAFQTQPFEAVWAIFETRRRVFVDWLRRLEPQDLERVGTHPMHGIIPASRVARSIPAHDQNHYGQIEANLAHYASTP
jgi:hypothetical protein